MKDKDKCRVIITRNGVTFWGHKFFGFRCVDCRLEIDEYTYKKMIANGKKNKQ